MIHNLGYVIHEDGVSNRGDWEHKINQVTEVSVVYEYWPTDVDEAKLITNCKQGTRIICWIVVKVALITSKEWILVDVDCSFCSTIVISNDAVWQIHIRIA